MDPRITQAAIQPHSLNVAHQAKQWEHGQRPGWRYVPCGCVKCEPQSPLNRTPLETAIAETLDAAGQR